LGYRYNPFTGEFDRVEDTSGNIDIETLTGNSGGAVGPDGANNVNILGTGKYTFVGNPGTNTLTLDDDGTLAETYTTDSGNATPAANIINIFGTTAVAGTNPLGTSGAGNTVTITNQISQALAAADATRVGLSNFDSIAFSVDADGFVTLTGGGSGLTITGDVGGALSPTAGNWNIIGGTSVAGTSPLVTSGAGSTLTINAQISQALAAADATKIGLSNFDSSIFTVDADGFVELSTTGLAETITGDSGGALSPTANNWNIIGQDGITTSGAVSTLTITPRGVGTQNMFLGFAAGNLTLSGGFNVGYGAGVLAALTSGNSNVAVGVSANASILGGNNNVAVGRLAGAYITSGNSNISIGINANGTNVSTSFNVAIGTNALNLATGGPNLAIGGSAGASITSASQMTVIGYNAFAFATGAANTGLGYSIGSALLTGAYNVAIGDNAGSAWTGAESSNINISHVGVVGDNNTIRIGTQGTGNGQVDSCFIAGIVGVTVANAVNVVIDSTSGEIGVGPSSFLGWIEVTGTTQAMAVNTGYILNNAGLVTATLPSTAAVGDVMRLAGKGAGGWLMAQNAGQTVHFGSSDTTTGAGGSLASTDPSDTLEILCTTANTDFTILSSIGNLTVV
jgi:hypothetical protein